MSNSGLGAVAEKVGSDTAPVEKSARSDGKTRVQFDLPARSMSLLTDLKERTDASTYAEVFKNALKLYDGIVTEVERGGEFFASVA
jgi:hypothetical protein